MKTKIILSAFILLILASVFAVTAFAATPASGYMLNENDQKTNIKWSMDKDGVLTFSIDPTATSNVASTVILNKDPVTKGASAWNKYNSTYADAVKVVVGDGITSITGFACLENLETVELAPSVNTIGDIAFEKCEYLKSIYLKGTTPIDGHYDLSKITNFGPYCFDGTLLMKSVTLNPNLTGEIGKEVFKSNAVTEFTIPAGVTKLTARCFMKTEKMEVLTVLGSNTEIESIEVFQDNGTYPAIKAKVGSKAEAFAKENGFTFIDIDTEKITPGTRPTTGYNTSAPTVTIFNSDDATAWGHLTSEYEGKVIIDTWWAYYSETKTLEFISGIQSWNETGTMEDCDSEYGDWSAYKNEIEHIILDDYICKISNGAFLGHKALKDVRIGSKLVQIDGSAFEGCSNLTTLWRNGQERVEGRVNLTGISNFYEAFSGTAVSEMIVPVGVKEITIPLPKSLKTIYVYEITDSLISFAKENYYNLQNIMDPSEKYEYYVYIDPTLPSCGPKATYAFDEATGTLTISGVGIIDDIVNYYGGGSKTQPWFEFRDSIKHIVIEEGITSIGRYNFCECKFLETVQLPDTDGFEILNGAFEECNSLKSVYIEGTDPIEGTADLRTVHTLNYYTFSRAFLIANAIISPKVETIGSSVFYENVNLANIYGTPGSYAETFASDNELPFYDISKSTPSPISCTAPETTEGTYLTRAPLTEAPYPYDTKVPESDSDTESIPADVSTEPQTSSPEDNKTKVETNVGGVLTIIIAVVAVAAVAAAALFIIKKKKK